jgi:Ankyrin repeats (3 copies)
MGLIPSSGKHHEATTGNSQAHCDNPNLQSEFSHQQRGKEHPKFLRTMTEDNHQIPMTAEEDCLLRASSAGDVPEVERLLQNATMLSAALRVSSQPLRLGLDRTVLHLLLMVQDAAKTGQASMVEFFLHVGNLQGIQPAALINSDSISNAIASKEVGVLKNMFAAMPSLISYNLGMGLSPLEHSIGTGSIPFITFLLENGADPNYSFNSHTSSLQDAVGRSSLQIVELLLWFGASTWRSWACHAAARYGRADVLTVLLEHGADISKKFTTQRGSYYKDLETPLDIAARHKQTAAAKWLSNNGAELNSMDAAELTLFTEQAEETKGSHYRELSCAGCNNHHTEEQWLRLTDDDEDTPEAAATRMAARRVRREQNRRERLAQTSGSIEDTRTA